MNGNLLPGTLEVGFRLIYLADRESLLLGGCDLETNGATTKVAFLRSPQFAGIGRVRGFLP